MFRVKQDNKQPGQSVASQAITVLVLLTVAAIDMVGIVIVSNGVASGQVYLPTVAAFGTKVVNRYSSPNAYWGSIIFYSVGVIAMLAVLIFGFRDVFIANKRRGQTVARK